MSHHSFFLLVSGPDSDSFPVEMLRSRFRLFDRAMHCAHNVTKGHGRFFGMYLVLREILESTVQLVGINSTAQESDHETVAARTSILSANLMLLPVSAFLSNIFFGSAATKVSVIIVESIFDNLFIAVGVTLQREASEGYLDRDVSGSDTFGFHLVRALLFCCLLFCSAAQIKHH